MIFVTRQKVRPFPWESEDDVSIHLILSASLRQGNVFTSPVSAAQCIVLLYLHSGRGRLEVAGICRELDPHSAVLFPNWQAWELLARSELSLELIAFAHPRQAQLVWGGSGSNLPVYPVSELSNVRSIFPRFGQPCAQVSQSQNTHLLCTLLKSLWSDGSQEDEAPMQIPPQIQRMKELIDTQFGTELSLDALAQQLGQSKFHLSRTFQACYHMTPGAYLICVRLRQAARLLQTTKLPIKEIGSQVGYPNDAYFIALFKKHYGLTPKQYRTGKRFQT